jgi:hypothetical protein
MDNFFFFFILFFLTLLIVDLCRLKEEEDWRSRICWNYLVSPAYVEIIWCVLFWVFYVATIVWSVLLYFLSVEILLRVFCILGKEDYLFCRTTASHVLQRRGCLLNRAWSNKKKVSPKIGNEEFRKKEVKRTHVWLFHILLL